MTVVFTTLLRVMVPSIAISCGIVYGGPLLNIPANTTTATIGVFLPSLVLALLLGWWQISDSSRK
jgi:hypothetical protein